MNSLFARVFYINLDRRPERNIKCQTQLANAGVDSSKITRLSATDALTANLQDYVGTVWTHTNYWAGVHSCAISHYRVWQTIYNDPSYQPDDWILILEDDMLIHPSATDELWKTYWQSLPKEASFVFVGCIRNAPKDLSDVGTRLNPYVVQLHHAVFSSHAYAIKKKRIQEAFPQVFPTQYAIDYFFWTLKGPLYAFLEPPNTQVPESFYRIERPLDEDLTLTYTGLISVDGSASDIQYQKPGIEKKLEQMKEWIEKGPTSYPLVLKLAAVMKPEMMKQLYYKLYLEFLYLVGFAGSKKHATDLLNEIETNDVAMKWALKNELKKMELLVKYTNE